MPTAEIGVENGRVQVGGHVTLLFWFISSLFREFPRVFDVLGAIAESVFGEAFGSAGGAAIGFGPVGVDGEGGDGDEQGGE